MTLRALQTLERHFWLGSWLRDRIARRREHASGPRHLLFALTDHWEPGWGDASRSVGDARVQAWADGYPALAAEFRDADGKPPRHSFFFPGEQYVPEWMDSLAKFTRRGLGEVELHLHHDGDSSAGVRRDIDAYVKTIGQHGHFSRDADGRPRFAFIHGNWCLSNARRDGKWCGVDDEVSLLFEAGCYADFTFPSAPDESQPRIVNSIYWPVGDLSRRRAYERGARARVGEIMHDRILMIQGPLALGPHENRRVGLESGNLQASNPPSARRIRTWVEQEITIQGRPEWVFVKVYTHGAPEAQARAMLGEGVRAMHRELTTRYNDGKRWVLHYVTAREMYNVAMAALAGKSGDPGQYRDHVLRPPPAA